MREVGERIEREFLEQPAIDRVRGEVRDIERVAVGRGAGGILGRDVRAAAGLVLDDDRLAEDFVSPWRRSAR